MPTTRDDRNDSSDSNTTHSPSHATGAGNDRPLGWDNDRIVSGQLPKALPTIQLPLSLEHTPSDPDIERAAQALKRALLKDLIKTADGDLANEDKEPPHPFARVCRAWRAAIQSRDIVQAELMAQQAYALFSMYRSRPAFELPFGRLRLVDPLSPDNAEPLGQLIAAAENTL